MGPEARRPPTSCTPGHSPLGQSPGCVGSGHARLPANGHPPLHLAGAALCQNRASERLQSGCSGPTIAALVITLQVQMRLHISLDQAIQAGSHTSTACCMTALAALTDEWLVHVHVHSELNPAMQGWAHVGHVLHSHASLLVSANTFCLHCRSLGMTAMPRPARHPVPPTP